MKYLRCLLVARKFVSVESRERWIVTQSNEQKDKSTELSHERILLPLAVSADCRRSLGRLISLD